MKKAAALILALFLLIPAIPFGVSAINADAYDEIVKGMYLCEERIDISDCPITVAELSEIMYEIMYNEPYLFHVNSGYSYGIINEAVVSVAPMYTMTVAEYAVESVYFANEIERISQLVPAGLTDIQKALFLHDYLCVRFEYDFTYASASAYSILKTGSGTCMAYTLLYDALLQEQGIEALPASSNEINHVWNVIEIDDTWYHVDVTWDDPTSDRFGRAVHDNFLRSTAGIVSEGHNGTIICDESSDDSTYDDLAWHSLMVPFGFADGKTYCIDNGVISEINIENGEKNEVYSYDDKWFVWGSDSMTQYYTGVFSGFGSYDNALLFNDTDTVFAYIPAKDEVITIAESDRSEGYIYALYVDGDYVKYMVSQNYNADNNTRYYEKQFEIVHRHKLQFFEEVPATCTHEGTKAYYGCSSCGKTYSDEACENELTDLVIAVNPDNHIGGTATCINKAICTECNKEYGEVNANYHIHTEPRGSVAATEQADGYTGDTFCTDCNTTIATGEVIPKIISDIEFKDNSTLFKDGNFIKGIVVKTSVSYLLSQLKHSDGVTVKAGNGTVLTEDSMLSTGLLLVIGSKTYTLVVKGELSGDGVITATDYSICKRMVLGSLTPTEVQKAAADINGNGSTDSIDYAMIKRHVLETFEIK